MSLASCPRCGAPLQFPIGGGVTVVCGSCKSVVARTDRGLTPTGQAADVSRGDASLSVGDKVKISGKYLTIVGVTLYAHSAGGSWEEYTVYEGASRCILSHAQGRWALVTPVAAGDAAVPELGSLRPGLTIALGVAGAFTVAEVGQGTMSGGEGELARGAAPGSAVWFADLEGPGGGIASIDYGQGALQQGDAGIAVYVGKRVLYADLEVTRAGLARGEVAAATTYTCPKCGAPLDLLSGAAAITVSCKYCGTVSEPAGAKILAEHDLAGRGCPIPLGSKGALGGTTWTVVGYMTRSATEDGDTYTWQEYLLYEAGQGFAWLVIDDEGTWLARSVSSNEISGRDSNHAEVQFGGERYLERLTITATVLFVIGEFYWRVAVGESVQVTDYALGNPNSPKATLAREISGGEANWSHAQRVNPAEFRAAFGQAVAKAPSDKKGLTTTEVFVLFVIGMILLAIVSGMLSSCSGLGSAVGNGVGYIGGVRGGSSGGFGGK